MSRRTRGQARVDKVASPDGVHGCIHEPDGDVYWVRQGHSRSWYIQKPGLSGVLVGIIGGVPQPLVCVAGWLGWATAPSGSPCMRYGIWAELSRQLHPLVCALAGTGDRPNLTLYWLVHTELSLRSPQTIRLLDSDPSHRDSHRVCGLILDWVCLVDYACAVASMHTCTWGTW